MNKISCGSQSTEPKLGRWFLHLWSLWMTQLTADLPPKWNGGSMFHPLSHIYAKTPFCCVETIAKHSESSTHSCFWSTVSKRSIHFEHSFLIDKFSCKMVNTLPSDIFNYTVISRNFNLRSAKTSLWSFLVFSRTTGKFGRLERSASLVSVRPRLKSAYQHFYGTEFE